MGEITLEGFDVPRNRRDRPEGALVDVQGWLHAPTDWDRAELEHLWNRKHGTSRLGIGLCVANSTRRHFVLTNVPEDLELVRGELESLIAELSTQTPAGSPAEVEPVGVEPES